MAPFTCIPFIIRIDTCAFPWAHKTITCDDCQGKAMENMKPCLSIGIRYTPAALHIRQCILLISGGITSNKT